PAGDLVDLALGGGVEARQTDLGGPVRIDGAAVSGGRLGDGQGRVDVLEVEVPLALTVGGEAVAQGAVGDRDPTGAIVPDGGLELGVGGVGLGGDGAAEVGGGDEAAGPAAAVAAVFEVDAEGQVRVGADIGVEVIGLRVDEALLAGDLADRRGTGPGGAGGRGQPSVGERPVPRIARGDGDDLPRVVGGRGHPVGGGGAGQGHVRAPHHQGGGVPPVTGFGNIGLVAEDLGGCWGQVGVPVVERQHRTADELVEAGSRGERDRTHRGGGGASGGALGSEVRPGVDRGGGGDLDGPGPGRAHESALAAHRFVPAGLDRVLDHGLPRQDRVVSVGGLGLAEQAQQGASDIGIA